ncbi:Uma2 family endonuclease [Streptomyces sp. NPDC057694]|uniref:Uma2 family endonuclease n=1 Tax=Streptomyces sp. NPDC057694 TaxID=3346216 RepID=UPI003676F921
MSALAVSHDSEQSWDDLVRFWAESEWPEGSKVEIIEGIVTVSPTPVYRHNLIAARIQRRLYGMLPKDFEVFQTLAIAMPSRLGMFIPDLLVAPVLEEETPSYIPAGLAELVVEVTSRPNARHDRITKCAAYAAAGIPLYLLVDPWAPDGPTVTLYGEPQGDTYRALATVKFGDAITLPAPFDLTIDTGEFPKS